jgi:hypothetical protein
MNATATIEPAAFSRKILRTRNSRFCEVQIKLEDGCLSVCGTEGRIIPDKVAKKEALAYWISFFEDNAGEIQAMNQRCGSRCITPRGAAKYVLANDGELHGLDVFREYNQHVYLVESCGQIRETIAEWFPQVVPLFDHHLNGLKAACEHQEAEGWDKRPIDPAKPLNAYGRHYPGQRQDSWNMLTWVRPDEHPGGLLTAPCPTCGYEYGTAWLKRELPAEIVKLAETVE